MVVSISLISEIKTISITENCSSVVVILQFHSPSLQVGSMMFLKQSITTLHLTLLLLSPVPMWAVGAIVVVVLALVACLGFCIYKKCFNKGKKQKKARERKGGGGRGRRKKDQEGAEGEEKK
ncbi:hypothetical protein AMECASPLE_036105, partial [Ameca splendens]